MRMRIGNFIRTIAALLGTAVVVVAYNNCGKHVGYVPLSVTEQSVCAEDLVDTFESTYRPYLADSANCAGCHADQGASPFKFASADLQTAYGFFQQIGPDRLETTAVNPSHAVGITGPERQAAFDSLRMFWDQGVEAYNKCMSRDTSGTTSYDLVQKAAETIYFSDNRTQTLSWTLTLPEDLESGEQKMPAQFLIDVRINYQDVDGVNTAVGYTFANPRLAMLTGEQEIAVEGLFVKVNGTILADLVPFAAAKGIARGADPLRIYDGELSATLAKVANVDRFSFSFKTLTLRSRTDNPPIPPAPTLTVANTFVSTTRVNVTIGGDSTARRWCLTTSAQPPASTDQPCPGQQAVAGSVLGWATSRPTNFDLLTAGAAQNGDSYTIYLWVANRDLKISTTAPSVTVTVDNVRPPAPVITSVTLNPDLATGTQIASLDLQNNPDAASWCVKEASELVNIDANGCRFVTTKPTVVGVTGNGNRRVAAFIRDRAGNTSVRSNVITVNSPFPQISFTQLTDPSANARAMFKNRCTSCHQPGGSAAAIMDLTVYAQAVAKKSQILQRIESTTLPMPPTGLLSDAERALIRLWIQQTATPLQ